MGEAKSSRRRQVGYRCKVGARWSAKALLFFLGRHHSLPFFMPAGKKMKIFSQIFAEMKCHAKCHVFGFLDDC